MEYIQILKFCHFMHISMNNTTLCINVIISYIIHKMSLSADEERSYAEHFQAQFGEKIKIKLLTQEEIMKLQKGDIVGANASASHEACMWSACLVTNVEIDEKCQYITLQDINGYWKGRIRPHVKIADILLAKHGAVISKLGSTITDPKIIESHIMTSKEIENLKIGDIINIYDFCGTWLVSLVYDRIPRTDSDNAVIRCTCFGESTHLNYIRNFKHIARHVL